MAFGCDCISTKFEDHTTILNHSAIAHFAAMTLCYLVTKGRGQGHVTYFLNFGTPSVTFINACAQNYINIVVLWFVNAFYRASAYCC